MKNYLREHVRVFLATLGTLARTPLATLMTVAVIGITLALPAGLFAVTRALQNLSGGWDRSGEISAFLKSTTDAREAQALRTRIQRWPDVDAVTYLTPGEALAEFRRLSGADTALQLLADNPLPGVLLVRPHPQDAAGLQDLLARLRAQAEVETAHLDLQWVQRLQALLRIGERAVLILAVLLALGVMLIVGNTIRLAVLNRQAEIEIMTLVGATRAFVRRPFLYSGMLQGALGGLAASLLILASAWLLATPLRELLSLYGDDIRLPTLIARDGLYLVLLGSGLGYIAARFAVQRHL